MKGASLLQRADDPRDLGMMGGDGILQVILERRT
jgi:hypothetical protein